MFEFLWSNKTVHTRSHLVWEKERGTACHSSTQKTGNLVRNQHPCCKQILSGFHIYSWFQAYAQRRVICLFLCLAQYPSITTPCYNKYLQAFNTLLSWKTCCPLTFIISRPSLSLPRTGHHDCMPKVGALSFTLNYASTLAMRSFVYALNYPELPSIFHISSEKAHDVWVHRCHLFSLLMIKESSRWEGTPGGL